MEDASAVSLRGTQSTEKFVVRQFSPARIERLLLTRLFELAGGQALAGFGDDTESASVTAATARSGEREAA